MTNSTYNVPAYLMEKFVKLHEEYLQEHMVLDMLYKGQDKAVVRLFRELLGGNYKEEAHLVERVYNAYYPNKKLV